MTWRERLERAPGLLDLTTWPALDPALIQPRQRQGYHRNTRMVAAILAGNTAQQVARTEGVSPGRVSQLLDRCLGGADSQPPALRLGLVPRAIHPHRLSDDGRRRGCFRTLLDEVPGLRQGLDQLILDRLKDRPFATPLSPHQAHGEFKRLLANAGQPLDQYPYTTVDTAYESLRRYLTERWQTLCQARKARRRGYCRRTPDNRQARIFERIEIDEQTLDCHTSSYGVELTLTDSLPPMRLSRLTLLCAVDTVSDCVLGYYLAPTGSANQLDILALLELSLSHSTPRDLVTTEQVLAPGAGFPNLLEDLALPPPLEVALDNAWCHHANSVEAFVCGSLCATLSFGPRASPTVRHCIESVFARVNARLSHRLPSTTGSSVTDPKRESTKNRKRPPVVSLAELDELLYGTLAELNGKPRPHLGNASPLDVVRNQCETLYLPYVDEQVRAQWAPFVGQAEVSVHGRSDLHVRPYINFEYCKYHGPGLLAVPACERTVAIEFDRRDIRRLRLRRLNGVDLGVLDCPASWRGYAHSVSTRRLLFREHRTLTRRSENPLSAFLAKKRREIASPSDATEFLHLYQEFRGKLGLPASLWSSAASPISASEPVTPASERTDSPKGESTSTLAPKRFWSLALNRPPTERGSHRGH